MQIVKEVFNKEKSRTTQPSKFYTFSISSNSSIWLVMSKLVGNMAYILY